MAHLPQGATRLSETKQKARSDSRACRHRATGTELIQISRLKVVVPTEAHPRLNQSRLALTLATGHHDGHVHCGGQLAHAVVASCIRPHTVQPSLGLHHCGEEFHALPP